MESNPKDIELSPVNSSPDNSRSAREKFITPANDEEDVIIGRFRKISSAKSMAATNGNIQYPSEIIRNEADVEAGLQFKVKECEKERLLPEPSDSNVVVLPKSPVTKSSFRDMEKPSRFKDQPSTTRFQVGNFLFIILMLYFCFMLIIINDYALE